MRRWTDAEDSHLISLLRADPSITTKRAAAILNRNSGSVLARARLLKIPNAFKNKFRKYDDDKIEEIRALLVAGKSLEDISSVTNLSIHTISHIISYNRISPCRRVDLDSDATEMLMNMLENGTSWSCIVGRFRRPKIELMNHLFATKGDSIPAVVEKRLYVHGQSEKCILKGKLSYAKNRSKQHGWAFELSYEFIMSLFKAQNGKCYYTGIPMRFKRNDPHLVSIDRLDSREGYTKKNVVLCIWDVN